MMKPSPVTPEYQKIADAMVEQGAEMSKMFGVPCLKIGGKAFASVYASEMVFKLSGETHKKALAMDGAHLFDPGDNGRPMKEWVVVPTATLQMMKKFAEEAMAYTAASAKAKPTKPKSAKAKPTTSKATKTSAPKTASSKSAKKK